MKRIGFRKMTGAIVALALIGLSGGASAGLLIEDTTYFGLYGTSSAEDLDGYGGDYVKWLEYSGDYVAWTHHYDFDPSYGHITNASLMLYFYDDDPRDRWWAPWEWEIGAGIDESGAWEIGGIDTGSYTFDVGISTLTDGKYSLLVSSLLGDFKIKKSILSIHYDPKAVPEPGTLLLLGSALLAMAAVNRRRRGRT